MPTTRYTTDHEYIRVEGKTGVAGITDHAQKALGEIVFVELPGIGDNLSMHDECGTVESVKAVSEIFAPVSGTVVEVNGALAQDPDLVNDDPSGKGWLFKIKLTNDAELASLMDENAYCEYVKTES